MFPISYLVLGVPRASPFFTTLPLLCTMLNTNRRTKMGEAWEQGYNNVVRTDKIASLLIFTTVNFFSQFYQLSNFFLSRYVLAQRNSTWFTRLFFSHERVGLGTRLQFHIEHTCSMFSPSSKKRTHMEKISYAIKLYAIDAYARHCGQTRYTQ